MQGNWRYNCSIFSLTEVQSETESKSCTVVVLDLQYHQWDLKNGLLHCSATGCLVLVLQLVKNITVSLNGNSPPDKESVLTSSHSSTWENESCLSNVRALPCTSRGNMDLQSTTVCIEVLRKAGLWTTFQLSPLLDDICFCNYPFSWPYGSTTVCFRDLWKGRLLHLMCLDKPNMCAN